MNSAPLRQRTVTATELKAKCLDILDRLAAHELDEVFITKRGRIVGVLHPPARPALNAYDDLFGCVRGTVTIPPGFDLTEPALQEPFTTITQDKLHE